MFIFEPESSESMSLFFFVFGEEDQKMLFFFLEVVHRINGVLMRNLDVGDQVWKIFIEEQDRSSGENEEVIGF